MGQADDAVAFARAQLGKPYVWATSGPDTYDCSGLVKAAYDHAKPPIILPHYTGAMLPLGTPVTAANLEVGDVIFPHINHCQLYVGNNQVIEAGDPVQVSSVGTVWQARRYVTDGKKGSSLTEQLKLDAFENPISATMDSFEGWTKLAKTVTDPRFWSRVGMFTVGGFLIVTGIIFLNRRPILGLAGGVLGAAGNVAGTAVQGAAFGFGASKTGGNSAAATAVPGIMPGPRPTPPPRKAVAPSPSPPPGPAKPPAPSGPSKAQAQSVPRTTRKSSVPGRFVDYGPVGKHRVKE